MDFMMKLNNLLVIFASVIVSSFASAQTIHPVQHFESIDATAFLSVNAKPKTYCLRCDDIGCEKIPCPKPK
ncbi:MAG: hypothetical protein KKA56_11605 [Gammaproteobacteria bacterium]|jgi:hypothetical protein|nr:hypothetical protein [Gammaproteobacteria bacterium]